MSTTSAAAGRRADADRRHQRVLGAITAAIAAGEPGTLTASGLARAAGVHRTYLYRHPDLLDLIHQRAGPPPKPHGDQDRVTTASLRADLAHARDRATRTQAENVRLQRRLSECLGQQVWAETGLGPFDEAEGLRREIEQLRQQVRDLADDLDERTHDLDAVRAANRELMARINGPRSS